MTRTTLKIEGMSCGHCVASVKNALLGLDGVAVQSVSVGSAIVEYDPAVVAPERIVEAVDDAGYSTSLAA